MGNIEDLLRKRKEVLEEIDRQIMDGHTKSVTLLFTDIVGSTQYFEKFGDIAGRQMIQVHNDLLFKVIEKYDGKIIKTIGDSIMASFEDPTNSVRCAVEMQHALKEYNSGKSDKQRIRVRMGLHYGRAVVEGKDLFGDMVNTAARVESKADGEEILISSALKEKVQDPNVSFVFLGSEAVKGKEEKINFYFINWNNTDQNSIIEKWKSKKVSFSGRTESKKEGVVIKGNIDLKTGAAALKPVSYRGNPYLNRVMIPHPELFYGRESIVKRIFSRISSERPQSISIVGERRIGKSSMLNFINSPVTRLKHMEKPEQYIFLFIDFQQFRLKSPEELIGVIYSELTRQTENRIEINLPENYDGLGRLCEAIASNGYRLIMLFDEFEAVTKNEKIGPEFYSIFRSLANTLPIAFITASGKNLKEMCASHAISDSPFFNIFTVQYLGAFREKEALALISEPSERASIPLKPVSQSIVSMAGFYPFFIQIACSAWYEYLESEGQDAGEFASRSAPKGVLDIFREEVEPHYEYILENLLPEEKEVMLKVMNGEKVTCDDYHADGLERKGYLTLLEDDAFRIFSKEFEKVLKRG
ncbi:MAG: adenylate/guanylate cyclase domain-containing protein [Spirochaetales bacterium]|nr:adenylate/guanylate cyclase domain-containing protein [Spirochaetales bacterium]